MPIKFIVAVIISSSVLQLCVLICLSESLFMLLQLIFNMVRKARIRAKCTSQH